jgi:hypothetical protein
VGPSPSFSEIRVEPVLDYPFEATGLSFIKLEAIEVASWRSLPHLSDFWRIVRIEIQAVEF